MSKARTEQGDFLFKVSQYGGPDYQPFIMTEPRVITTTLVGENAFVAFDIHAKTFEEAQQIANFLNDHIDKISFTIFEDHPMFYAVPPK